MTNIPHALHMPGHIYSQTGRWSDAEKSFRDAAQNERKWMAQDKLYGDGHHGHNVHYLATAYSFEGRYDDAIEAARELLQFKENPAQVAAADGVGSARAQGWFAMLRTLVQFEKWDVILAGEMLPVLARPRQEAWRHWARALAFANTGNAAKAREELAQFDAALTDYRARTKRANPTELEVARQELQAHLELADGHTGTGAEAVRAGEQSGTPSDLHRAAVLSATGGGALGACGAEGEQDELERARVSHRAGAVPERCAREGGSGVAACQQRRRCRRAMTPTPKSQIAAAYSAAADHYDAPPLSFWNYFGERTVKRVALRPGEIVLDVCCGAGASALPAAQTVTPGGRVIGVDLAPPLLALARAKATTQGIANVEFRHADFDQVYFRPASFDAVVCVFGLFFFPDMVASLQKMWRFLRPGGRLVVTTWGPDIVRAGATPCFGTP